MQRVEPCAQLAGLPDSPGAGWSPRPPEGGFREESMRPEEYDAMQEEVANISVRNLATFWEDLSRQVEGEVGRTGCPSIKKKWNSMPELKVQPRRRQPEVPTQDNKHTIKNFQNRQNEEPEVVKSDYVVDDVDLCRSVSIKERREMFESLEHGRQREITKQWSSMPSLKPEAALPATPLLVTSAITCCHREDPHSSSDSVCSSLTSSSTVVPAPELLSLVEDSAGEIYTGSQDGSQLFLVENGSEVPLTPLVQRKTVFERFTLMHSDTRDVLERPASREARSLGQEAEARPASPRGSISLPAQLVRSSSRSYIEEEKDVLKNINIVNKVKKKFLQT